MPETDPEPPARSVPRRRRAGRTVALIAVAAVLGVIGGTAVGYGIQAERPPTPLPALNQPGLAYPAEPLPKGEEPAPLPAAEDAQAKANGDLRKLLVPRPAGARENEFGPRDGWYDIASYARDFKDESWMLTFLGESRLRRIAFRSWESGENRTTIVRLVQFAPSGELGAVDHAEDQLSYMDGEEHADDLGDAIKGSGNGRYFVYPVQREDGYLDLYRARAIFQHGDVMAEIDIYDTKKIGKNDIRTLAEKQLERL
ncbi:hypothetical protein [Streptomyces sp. NPDC058486]|uniref:hypothetical protein n=1 Tax=unclassified Streptomyces TaxID=2593676 RepID=UPI00365256A2